MKQIKEERIFNDTYDATFNHLYTWGLEKSPTIANFVIKNNDKLNKGTFYAIIALCDNKEKNIDTKERLLGKNEISKLQREAISIIRHRCEYELDRGVWE